jgi:hypothetical protein
MGEHREERIARTESLFREVNERITESVERFGADAADLVCECADPRCADRLQVALDEYERVRRRPERFVLAPGHEDPSVEATVERRPRFHVVEKRAPRAAAVARRLDPRAAPIR